MDTHDPRSLIMTGFAFMSVGAQRSCHSPDAISALVLILNGSGFILEPLIFLHSFARVVGTTIKSAPVGMV